MLKSVKVTHSYWNLDRIRILIKENDPESLDKTRSLKVPFLDKMLKKSENSSLCRRILMKFAGDVYFIIVMILSKFQDDCISQNILPIIGNLANIEIFITLKRSRYWFSAKTTMIFGLNDPKICKKGWTNWIRKKSHISPPPYQKSAKAESDFKATHIGSNSSLNSNKKRVAYEKLNSQREVCIEVVDPILKMCQFTCSKIYTT